MYVYIYICIYYLKMLINLLCQTITFLLIYLYIIYAAINLANKLYREQTIVTMVTNYKLSHH